GDGRAQGVGEGPCRALSVGRGAGRRPAPLPGGPSGRGPPAEPAPAIAEVGAATPSGGAHGRRLARTGNRGAGGRHLPALAGAGPDPGRPRPGPEEPAAGTPGPGRRLPGRGRGPSLLGPWALSRGPPFPSHGAGLLRGVRPGEPG